MLKRFATVLIASLSLCAAVTAQNDPSQQNNSAQTQPAISPQKQALVAELLRITESKKQTEEILNATLGEFEKQTPEIIWASLSESPLFAKLTETEREQLRTKIAQDAIDMGKRFRELLSQRLNFAKLDEITELLYAKYFTETEITDLIEFYKSSTGRRTLQVMPQMFAESIARSQEVMMPILREIMRDVSTEQTDKFEKEVAAIVESHHRAPKKPGSRKRRPK